MRRLLLSTMVLLFAFSGAMAQDRTVSGRITSTEDGSSLPGVNVVLKGTTTGTASDADGRFTLSVPSGGTLVFSFIGLRSQEVQIGERTVVDVSMALDATQLNEVVVTGQNITQNRKALGYALSTVNSDQIAARPVNDIGRVLQGKVPGVVINPTGGAAGSGSAINIRGYSTITGNTQPLWVIDGIPFNTSTNNASGFTTGGTAATSSRFLDIDPNSIESMTVLKGLAATVLYGDQGRNGVILVTTKAGTSKRRGAEVTFQQSSSISEIASLPDLQNDYGGGFQQLYGAFFSNWGPHYNEIDSIGHPFQFSGDASLRNAFPEFFFKRMPFSPSPNNVSDFFRKGRVSNTSLSITGGTDKLGINASVGYTTEEGFAPGNDLKRLNGQIGFNGAITDKLTIRSSLMYANTDMTSPPLNGATGGGASFGGVPSLYANFLYTPRHLPIMDMPFETPLEHKSVWFRGGNDIPNARWIAKYASESDVVNRFTTSTMMTYDFNDNMALSYRVGLDTYTQRQNRSFQKGIGPTYVNINNGVLQTQILTNTIWNHDFIFSFNKELSSDISMTSRVGLNARNDSFERDGLYSEGQSVFGLMRHSNFATASSRSGAFGGRIFQYTEEQQRYGVYADVSFDYKEYLYLNLAARNDWTSNLEQGNNSLLYPSASVSFLPTEAFSNIKSNNFNFLKLRFSYGTSAGFPLTYTTRTVVGQNARGFVDAGGTAFAEHTIANQLGNLNLKAELQQEIETGFEAKFLNNRVGIDFTVYNRSTRDLITRAPIDPATGFDQTYANLGKLRNRGIEIGLNATPVRMANGLQWDVIWNFTLVRPEVVSLGGDIDQIVLAGFTDLGNFAVPGRPMNIIKGTAILRDPDGNKVVGADGLHILQPIIGELGDPNPDYLTTLINTVSFKGVSLSFQFDYRQGGMMYASTASGLLARGVLAGEDKFSRDLVYVLPGVKIAGQNNDGSNIYVPNDIVVTAADYGFNSQFFGRNDNAMFDGTTIRLREISLGYTLPRSLLSKTPIKGASIMLTGNNLWFNAVNVPKYVNFDPEVASLGVNEGAGFDYLTGPSTRRYGAVLRLTF